MKKSEDIANYLHRRLEHLEVCNAEIQRKLLDDFDALNQEISKGEYDERAVGQNFFRVEYVVGNTFRYTMLVGLCTFLEEAMKVLTDFVVSDYEAKLRKERKGDWLSKHMRILVSSADFDKGPIECDLKKFYDIISLRNCVVHQWGKIAEATDPARVKGAVERVETCEIFRDGYLFFGDQVIPKSMNTAENIAEHILTTKLGASMT